MMPETYRRAFAWALAGAKVFPVLPAVVQKNGKTRKVPAMKGWPEKAVGADNAADILDLFLPTHQVGIATEPSRLLVVDFDAPPESWVMSEYLPSTYIQRTPRGGQHWYFRVPEGRHPGSSASKIAPGVDIKSRGGYVLTREDPPPDWGSRVVTAPEWLLALCETKRPKKTALALEEMRCADEAREQAILFLKSPTCPRVESPGTNTKTYNLVLQLRDMGVDEVTAFELLSDPETWPNLEETRWPSSMPELRDTVRKAFLYAKGAAGAEAPSMQPAPVLAPSKSGAETIFDEAIKQVPLDKYAADHPLVKLNREYAWVICGSDGRVLWENSGPSVKLLREECFHRTNASIMIDKGDKKVPLTKVWMEWPHRRTYHDLVFKPSNHVNPLEYNLWRGWPIKPADAETSLEGYDGVKMWMELVQGIVCGGDTILSEWLLGYFAHMVQHPGEKPLTACVLKSEGKGTGKNSTVERVGDCLGDYMVVASKARYYEGNFNAHLERCLLLVLDEAFWTRGSKGAQAALQDLVTGSKHLIEKKGVDPYSVQNLTRVFLLSNSEWVVPASADERRYAVFEVNENRKQQAEWFDKMRVLMQEKEGNRWLIHYLMHRPVSNVNVAPKTYALKTQIAENLDPFDAWWLESLEAGRLVDSEMLEWPERISNDQLRDIVYRNYSNRCFRGVKPTMIQLGRSLRRVCPEARDCRTLSPGRPHGMRLPPLQSCRELWERHAGKWEWSDPGVPGI